MKIAIDQIIVDETTRIRKEVGNLKPLEDSITKVGLINPIVIDEQSNLVAGFRRLAACKNLEMTEIEVSIVDFDGDMMKMFDVEISENFFRKDFTPEEILSSEQRRQEIFEATRKKGFFERIGLKIKGLFRRKTVTPVTNTPSQPSSQPLQAQQPEQKLEPQADEDLDEQLPVTDQKQAEEPDTEHDIPEHSEKRDNHTIKWRTT